MKNLRLTLPALLVLLLALPAAAEPKQVIDETRPASRDGMIEVELIMGSIEVVGWDRMEVNVTGSINPDIEELDIDSDDDSVSIEVDLADGSHHNFGNGADLTIRVPRDSQIEIETISAGIEIHDVRGTLSVESVSGAVEIDGRITEVEVESISGDVEVSVDGILESGDFETVSADIDLQGRLSPRGRFSFESVNGTITLKLPSDTSAEFDVETFNGKIENAFGPRAKKASRYLPAQELHFTLGSGGARVTAESFNGSVRLQEK